MYISSSVLQQIATRVGCLQEQSGDGSEGAPQSVSKSDASPHVESAQATAGLTNNLTRPIAVYSARPLIRIMQNGSWAVGLQVSETQNQGHYSKALIRRTIYTHCMLPTEKNAPKNP